MSCCVRSENGYEAYRLIIKEVTPQDRARSLALLQELISTATFRQDFFMDDLRAFEQRVNEYTAASSEEFPKALGCAILMKAAHP